MVQDLTALADALLAGGALQILIGLAVLRFALGLTDLMVGLAIAIAAVSISLAGLSPAPSANSNPATVQAALLSRADADIVVAGHNNKVSVSDLKPQTLRAQVTISEIRRGLTWGVKMLIPFLLVDLLVAHLFAVLEWNSLPTHTISTPLKLIIFLTIGGWSQIASWLALSGIGGVSP